MQFWIWPSIHAYKIYPSQTTKTYQSNNQITDQGTLSQRLVYQYDANNGNPKVVTSVTSLGDTLIKMIKYASDFLHTGAGSGNNYQIDLLLDNNLVSAPVEIITLLKKKDSSASIVQNATLYEYDGYKVKRVYKVYDQIYYNSFVVSYNDANGFYKDSHYKLLQEVTAWDGTRPKTVITNTNKMSYTWDDKFQLPTSMINNASYEDVAYTSFEGISNGAWTVNSANRDSNYAVTGRRCYQLSNGNISKNGLTTGTTYIVSYWTRNGTGSSYTVSGSSNVKEGKTGNGWTYYEHSVSGVSSITVSGSGYIDELRIYPKSAQMETFCYEVLLGMTSQCDFANRITYYEFYGPDKLKLIRDQDKNILKKICYNYAGQPDYDCKPVYYNVDTSGNYTRSCSTNYTGSTVTYTVPAATYSSTISQHYVDSLAAANLSAHGQSYADSLGTCTATCNSGNCSGQDKCINGVCESGIMVVTYCHYDDMQNTSTVTYHYEWSDNSWSQDYTDYNLDGDRCEG